MTASVDFMKTLETDYRRVSGLTNRSQYKIFYGQVFPAPTLTLGLNPGGTPEGTSDDGTRQKDGSPASSSASFFEGMENDVLDCEWRENIGLRKLLLPLVGGDRDRFRREIIKTNIAFRRSRVVHDIDLAAAELEARPFVERMIARVIPRLIVLTGVSIDRFLSVYARDGRPLTETVKAPGINHVVFAAAAARLASVDCETIVVQVAHASQFAWTYERYGVSEKIAGLTGIESAKGGGTGSSAQSTSGSLSTVLPSRVLSHQPMQHGSNSSSRLSNPRLAELERKWNDLGIRRHFCRIHHSIKSKHSNKRETLRGFVDYCDCRDIRAENNQTVDRALDVARRVQAGCDIDKALELAWAAFPTVTT